MHRDVQRAVATHTGEKVCMILDAIERFGQTTEGPVSPLLSKRTPGPAFRVPCRLRWLHEREPYGLHATCDSLTSS